MITKYRRLKFVNDFVDEKNKVFHCPIKTCNKNHPIPSQTNEDKEHWTYLIDNFHLGTTLSQVDSIILNDPEYYKIIQC